MASASVIFDIIGRDRASDKFDKVGKSADRSSGKLAKLGNVGKIAGAAVATGFAAAAAVVVKGGLDAIGKASDLNETISKSQAIFGRNAAAMSKWADGAARSAGLSKAAALDAAAGFGDMFSQIGFGGNQAAKMSRQVVQMSADLGSFNNLGTDDVAERISAAFRGEYDSLQALIPNINAARVEQVALAKTGKDSASQLTAQEKAAAVLAIVHKDGARAMGDFQRTSGGLANQQKILKAQFENTQAAIGQKLLPVAVKLTTWFNDTGLPAIQRFGGYLGTVLPPIFERVKAVVARVTSALHGDVSKNIGGVREIFANAVSIIQSLWRAFGANIVQFLRSAMNNVRTVLQGAFTVIRGIFKTVSALLKGDWRGAWEGIKLILRGAVQVVIGIVRQLFNTVRFAFKNAGVAIKAVFRATWDGIKDLARAGATALVNGIKSIPSKILGLRSAFGSAGKALLQAFLNGMKSAGGFISGIAGNVWTAVRGMLNGAIDKINSALEFKIAIPAAPDVHVNPPNIPHLAKGGIVSRPTVALIGEAGPEAVVPLRGRYAPTGGGGGDVHIHLGGQVFLTKADVGRAVAEGLRAYQRQTGQSVAGILL